MESPKPKSSVLSTIVLTCASLFILFLFTRMEINKLWFEKVTSYWDAYQEQKNSDASIEEIKEERWGMTYKISKQIAKYFADRHVKHPVVLFEPNTYLEKTMGFTMPEPVVIYYFTGMKSVWTDCKTVNEATHIVRFKNGNMSIDSIRSPQELQQILTFYKPYPATPLPAKPL